MPSARVVEEKMPESKPVLPYEPSSNAPSLGRQSFGVVVRTLGLLIALYGIYCQGFSAVETTMTLAARYNPKAHAASGLAFLAFGILLLRGEWIVRFAYGREGNP